LRFVSQFSQIKVLMTMMLLLLLLPSLQ